MISVHNTLFASKYKYSIYQVNVLNHIEHHVSIVPHIYTTALKGTTHAGGSSKPRLAAQHAPSIVFAPRKQKCWHPIPSTEQYMLEVTVQAQPVCVHEMSSLFHQNTDEEGDM